MTTCCRDLECTLGDFLALDLLEVGTADGCFGFTRLRRLQHRRSTKVRQEREQVGRGNDLDIAGPRRLGALRGRADQPLPSPDA